MYKVSFILMLALVIMVPEFAAGQYSNSNSSTGSRGGSSNNSSSRGGSSSQYGNSSDSSRSSRGGSTSRSSSSRSSSSRSKTPTPRAGASKVPTPRTGATATGASKTGAKTTTKKSSSKTVTSKASRSAVDSFSATMAKEFVSSVPTASLHFLPMDLRLAPDEEFDVKVHLHNASTDVADSFAFSIEYDKPWLEFIGWEAKGLTELLGEENLKIETKHQLGLLSVSGSFSQPLKERDADLLELKFRARDIAGRTSLQFISNTKTKAAVFNEGRNILGKIDQGFRGILNANVFIDIPEDDTAQTTSTVAELDLATALPGEMPEDSASIDGWLTERYVPKPDAEVYLRLQGPMRPVIQKGSDFWVDIALYNDSLVPLESFGVKVEFDPKVLGVVDEDRGNWITLGTNIWDGPFHKNYPFDFHRANIADNRAGIIEYYLSRHTGSWPFSTGIISRIHFRARKATDVTSIRLVRGSKGRLETYVRGAGLDRLESTWGNGIPTNCFVRVVESGSARKEVSLGSK